MANGWVITIVEKPGDGTSKETVICASVNQNKITAAKTAIDAELAQNFRDDPVGTANRIKARVLEKTGIAIELTISAQSDAVYAKIDPLPVI